MGLERSLIEDNQLIPSTVFLSLMVFGSLKAHDYLIDKFLVFIFYIVQPPNIQECSFKCSSSVLT